MTKQNVYVFIAASLAFLVPPPGRFVYGLSLVIELNFLMLVGTFLSLFIKKFGFSEMETPFYLIVIVSATILYKQIFILLQTEVALTLGFDFYLPAVSSFLLGQLHSGTKLPFSGRLKNNMLSTMKFSLFALCFYLFRDIAGYGTFTFFGKNHRVFEKVIFNPDKPSIMSFFATIPGAITLCAVILAVYIYVNGRIVILKKSGYMQEEK